MSRGDEPAYPLVEPENHRSCDGLTVREAFAKDIYCRLRMHIEEYTANECFILACTEADALLAELGKRDEDG